MRLRVCTSGLALAVLAALGTAPSALALTRVTVRPGTGKPTTKFVLTFRAPARTGTIGTVRSHYQIAASGPKGKRCVTSVVATLGPTKLHAHVKVTLRPRGHGGIWCSGRFHGRVLEYQTVVCGPATACPDIAILPQTVARFSFTVKKPKTSAGGPKFAGLETVTTCVPLTPAIAPQHRAYTLKWKAASDPTTPASKIAYVIFYASKSGQENYSKSIWTTHAGATSFTGSLAGFGPAYFVVRARDKAGHEDRNRVQRTAVNIC